jgi:hypothetical protein
MIRHPKRRRDHKQFAQSIIDVATGQGPAAPPDNKDPAALQRGGIGGLRRQGEGGQAVRRGTSGGCQGWRRCKLPVEAAHAYAAYLVVRLPAAPARSESN